jgi:segregation and condensation protein B
MAVSKKDPARTAQPLVPAVGAMIFASDEPVQPKEIVEALGGTDLPEVEEAIRQLEQHYDQNPVGLRLEWIAGGVRLATRPEVGASVRQLFRQRNRTRLSLPALETLAIVAYRQPITAPEIHAIRGKDPAAAIKGLLDKKLLRILGRKKVVGSPLLYGTAKQFLHHFGLNNLEDLPSIEEFDQFLGAIESHSAPDAGESPADAADGAEVPADA